MLQNPIASVVIPTRNCLQWLPRALDSIGVRPDVEIIVFDDGSTDGTDAWLVERGMRDPRLVVMHGTGIGPSHARNAAIKAARGRYIAFLDADDAWRPGKLDIQLALHEAWPEAGFSFTDYLHVTPQGEARGTCFEYWPGFRGRLGCRAEGFVLGGDAVAQIFAENVVGTSTVIARTDLLQQIGGFAGDLPSSEDWDLWLRLARRAPVMCVPQVLADYLMHRPGNVTGNMRSRLLSLRVIAERHRAAVSVFGRAPWRTFKARIRQAEAELAAAEGLAWRAAGLQASAFLLMPSARGGRALLGTTRQALRAA